MKLWVVVVVGFLVASIDANPAQPDVNIEASGPTISIVGGEAGIVGTQGRRTVPVARVHPHEKRIRHTIVSPPPPHPAPLTLDIILKAIATFFEPFITFIKKFLTPSILTTISNVIVSFLEIEIIKNVISFLKSAFGGILKFLTQLFAGALFPVSKLLTTFLSNPFGLIGDLISTFVGFVVNFFKALVELFGNPISILETLFKPLIEGVEKLIGGSLKSLGSSLLKYLKDFFTNPLHVLKTVFNTIATTIGPVLLPVVLFMSGGPLVLMIIFTLFRTGLYHFGNLILTLLSFPITILTGGFNVFTFVINTIFSILGSIVSTFFGGFAFVFSTFIALFRIVGSTISTFFGLTNVAVTIFRVPFNVLGFFFYILSSIFDTILRAVGSLFGDAFSGITNVASLFGTVGNTATPLILSVIFKLFQSFISVPRSIFSILLSFIESALNIFSGSVFNVNKFFVGLISGVGKLFWSLLLPITVFINIGEVFVSAIFNIIKFLLSAPINLLRGPTAFLTSFAGLFTNIGSLALRFFSTLLGPIYSVITLLFSVPQTIATTVLKGFLAILSYVLQTIVALLGKFGGAVFSTITSPFRHLSEVFSALVGEIGQLAISATSLNDFFYKLPASVLKHKTTALTAISSLLVNFSSLLRGGVSKFFSVLSGGIWPLIQKIASFLLTPIKEVLSSILTLLSNFSLTELFSPLAESFEVFQSSFISAFNEIVQILSKGFEFGILVELQKIWSDESQHLLKSFRKLIGEIRKMAFHQSHDFLSVFKTLQESIFKILQLAYAVITDSLSPVFVPFGKLSSAVWEFLQVIVKFIASKVPVLGKVLL